MCKLINKSTGEAKKFKDVIYDSLGRPWEFRYCESATALDQAKVSAARITTGRSAKTPTTFILSFFPEYRVSVRS